mmetsp:Transcript_29277/g.75161  ORF Transcript_29277/g.75161 Transcript_29277/m.75161 type:complete len:283 (-) Transcript_29277:1409-2257(-)
MQASCAVALLLANRISSLAYSSFKPGMGSSIEGSAPASGMSPLITPSDSMAANSDEPATSASTSASIHASTSSPGLRAFMSSSSLACRGCSGCRNDSLALAAATALASSRSNEGSSFSTSTPAAVQASAAAEAPLAALIALSTSDTMGSGRPPSSSAGSSPSPSSPSPALSRWPTKAGIVRWPPMMSCAARSATCLGALGTSMLRSVSTLRTRRSPASMLGWVRCDLSLPAISSTSLTRSPQSRPLVCSASSTHTSTTSAKSALPSFRSAMHCSASFMSLAV